MDELEKKIWILDDDKSIRWVLQKALEKNNFTVTSFSNSNEAINYFNHDMPNLIISDIKMPGESGLQFLEKVKTKFPNIPIIIMTAFSDLDSAVDSYAFGAYQLGEPTVIGSGDDKVQYEWIMKFEGEIFTIYDWKTYDAEYTEYELDTWSVGGNGRSASMVNEFKNFIYEL